MTEINLLRVRVRVRRSDLLRGPHRNLNMIYDAVDLPDRDAYLLYAEPGTPQAEFLHEPDRWGSDGKRAILREAGLPEDLYTWFIRYEEAEPVTVEDSGSEPTRRIELFEVTLPPAENADPIYFGVRGWASNNQVMLFAPATDPRHRSMVPPTEARERVEFLRDAGVHDSPLMWTWTVRENHVRPWVGEVVANPDTPPFDEPETFSHETAPENVLLVDSDTFWIKRSGGAMFRISDHPHNSLWHEIAPDNPAWQDVLALGFDYCSRWDTGVGGLRRWSDLVGEAVPEPTPAEPEDTVESLQEEVQRLRDGLQVVEDEFWREAISRRWCEDAERVIRNINEQVGWTALRETRQRARTYEVELTIVRHVTVTATSPEEAHAEADRRTRRDYAEDINVTQIHSVAETTRNN